MNQQEQARQEASRIFDKRFLFPRGNGFYLYIEDLGFEQISRKGLEYCASEVTGKSLTLLTRNEDEQSYPRQRLGVVSGTKATVLQLTEHYERDQTRIADMKAKKLQQKYNTKK